MRSLKRNNDTNKKKIVHKQNEGYKSSKKNVNRKFIKMRRFLHIEKSTRKRRENEQQQRTHMQKYLYGVHSSCYSVYV